MKESDRAVSSVVDRRTFLALAGATGLSASAGCLSGSSPGETPTGDGSQSSTGTATPKPSPSVTGEGPVASLPVPDTDEVARPDGEAGNLQVLDWAGFESAVSYTFDDGQPSHLEHYDALNETGVNMTFYVSTGLDFEGWKSGWTQAAADGHEIGNHTVSHPHDDLTGSSFGEPLDSRQTEVEQCSTYITEEFGQSDVWTMAGPFGDEGWAETAEQADLFMNRGVGGGAVAPNDDTDPYNVPCYVAQEGDTAATFDEKVDAAVENGEWISFLFHSITPTDQKWYAPVAVEEITASVDHAKSVGDVWIDTVANVGAYWRGQQILTSAEPTESGDETVWEWSLPDGFPEGQRVRVTVDGGTLLQGGEELQWHPRGYYEVSLDEGSLTLRP